MRTRRQIFVRSLVLVALLACGLVLFWWPLPHARLAAQVRPLSIVSQDSGHVALGLAIRRLGVVGTFVQTPAHPDDEHNQLHAMLGLGEGLQSICVHTTRGAGGQNEIGPELFQDIAVLRTSELLAAHRLDGAEQWFTRAIDFGYSFSPPEIYETWGREEVVSDFVRFFRMLRPCVVLTMNIQGRGGDRAHEATAVLVREAFRAAGDPARFPEQIREGLRPWQPRKLYFTAAAGGGVIPAGSTGRAAAAPAPPPAPAGRITVVDTSRYDALLGRTYAEIGADARSHHKCQGMGQLIPLAGGIGGGRGGLGGGRYQLVDTIIPGQMDRDETSLFDGLDPSVTGLAGFAGANVAEALRTGLAAIADQARRARQAFATQGDAATAAPIAAGLSAVRSLRAALPSLVPNDQARYEIDFRLAGEERDFERALVAAHGLSFEALADDGLVIGGQGVKISLLVANRGAEAVTVAGASVAGVDGRAACEPGVVKAGDAYTCTVDVRIPADARLTTPYWRDEYWQTRPPKKALDIFDPDVPFGAPFRPTPFRAAIRLRIGGLDVTRDLPVQYRYVKDIFIGEKRIELNVVPAFSVRMTPRTAVIPAPSAAGTAPVTRDMLVSVTSGTKGAAQATVALELPAGWKATPATAPLAFTAEDESLTARFTITVPPRVAVGDYLLRAVVTSPATGVQRFASGYQEIDYPHIERRQVIKPAETVLKVMDVKVTPNIRLGYIVGAGDQVPPALEQLGVRLEYIGAEELAWGDLSKYDVIMTGVRAYERRADLRAYNRRLLDYAERGGTVIVQYNKMEFNQAPYAPYPAKVSTGRVTDERAPVKVLVPAHPVFNIPNRIGPAAWEGWVQERGLYFLGEKAPQYVDLVSMEDPFPDNPGVKTGALVEARYGKGRWLYVGLGLWRQLPAGTVGAYQLLANLISLSKAPAARSGSSPTW